MSEMAAVGRTIARPRAALKFRFDYWMLLSVAGLLVIGMLVVYSSTFDYGLRFQGGDATYYFRRQLVAMGLGLLGIAVIMQFDYDIFRKISVPFLGLALVGLVATLLVGETILGARRGLFEGSFQPSEFTKLAIIIYIAHWLSTKGDRITHLTYGLVPFSVIVGVVCALIVSQPNLSTSMLIALVSYILFFVAGADWKQFTLASLLALAIFVLLMWTLPHAQGRVIAYTEMLRDPSQAHWQVQQSLIALGSGGLFGVGLGEGSQKFGPLPLAHTDGAFAVLGEELGLFGCLMTIGLLAMLVWRGLRAAMKARSTFGFLLAVGITCWLAFQSLINIAVNTAVIPFTGIPLPFLSYGGSSLLLSLIGVGVLLNVSRDAKLSRRARMRQQPREKAGRTTTERARQAPKKQQGKKGDSVMMESLVESFNLRRRNRRAHLPRASRRY